MEQDAVVLDKRPVRPRKKRAKKRTKRKYVTKAQKEQALKEEALERQEEEGATAGSTPQPEGIEESDPKAPEAVTFFSKFKMDEIVIEPSKVVQLGSNKWYTFPARVARFNQHKFTTEDPAVIEYIRNPRNVYEKFDRYGKEVFEVGVKEHKERIHALSDEGVSEYLNQLHRGARNMAKHSDFSYEESV